MQSGFQTDFFNVVTSDGRNFTIVEDIDYISKDGRHFVIPVGATSDGASTPAILWPEIPPFGSYWRAAVLHDAAYRNTLLLIQQATDNPESITRTIANLPKDQCDYLLKEAMELSGTHDVTCEEIFKGVEYGGLKSFEEDRKEAQT